MSAGACTPAREAQPWVSFLMFVLPSLSWCMHAIAAICHGCFPCSAARRPSGRVRGCPATALVYAREQPMLGTAAALRARRTWQRANALSLPWPCMGRALPRATVHPSGWPTTV